MSARAEEEWNKVSAKTGEQWDLFCDWVESNLGKFGSFLSNHLLRRLTVEAPVVILFVATCVLIHVLNVNFLPGLNRFLAVRDAFQFTSVMQYPRLVTHTFAHDGLEHLKGNLVLILLVGPSAEHAYGSGSILLLFFLVALSSALAHIVLGRSRTHQFGASGIVFSVILLNSLVAAERGKIPIIFVLTAGLWLTEEVLEFVWGGDAVSHHAHLTGAIVGTATGYYLCGPKKQQSWMSFFPKKKRK
jgi:GlpG protein